MPPACGQRTPRSSKEVVPVPATSSRRFTAAKRHGTVVTCDLNCTVHRASTNDWAGSSGPFPQVSFGPALRRHRR